MAVPATLTFTVYYYSHDGRRVGTYYGITKEQAAIYVKEDGDEFRLIVADHTGLVVYPKDLAKRSEANRKRFGR